MPTESSNVIKSLIKSQDVKQHIILLNTCSSFLDSELKPVLCHCGGIKSTINKNWSLFEMIHPINFKVYGMNYFEETSIFIILSLQTSPGHQLPLYKVLAV